MGLIYECLLLAIFATFISHACIPTKTPQPGIPATPGGPKTCPTLTKWTTNCQVPGFMCVEAVVTPTSVSCADTSHTLVFRGGDGFQSLDTLECRGSDWWLVKEGVTLIAKTKVSAGEVACIFQ